MELSEEELLPLLLHTLLILRKRRCRLLLLDQLFCSSHGAVVVYRQGRCGVRCGVTGRDGMEAELAVTSLSPIILSSATMTPSKTWWFILNDVAINGRCDDGIGIPSITVKGIPSKPPFWSRESPRNGTGNAALASPKSIYAFMVTYIHMMIECVK